MSETKPDFVFRKRSSLSKRINAEIQNTLIKQALVPLWVHVNIPAPFCKDYVPRCNLRVSFSNAQTSYGDTGDSLDFSHSRAATCVKVNPHRPLSVPAH